MTFLGIGPGELFVILIILLVVVGPERLPGFARQAGKMIVSLRNWVQRSPDAMMLLRARDELEQELREIRDDLTQEMQTVRDEMVNVRNEVLQATREATIDVSRQLDAATHEIDLATHEAIETIQETVDTTLTNTETLNTPAVSSVYVNPIDITDTPSDQIAIVAQDLGADTLPDDGIHTIAPPELAAVSNGVPLTVPRTTKPHAPAIAADTSAPEDGIQMPDEMTAHASHDPTRTEIEALKQQLQNVTNQLHTLQVLIHQIQAELRPTEAALAEVEPIRQPEEAHDVH